MVALNNQKSNSADRDGLGRRLSTYTAAAAAIAAAGLAGTAQAAPILYDTEATPIDVHSSFNTLPNGQNMAAINPLALGAAGSYNSGSTTPTAAGLLGAATGAADNSGLTNGDLAGAVYFRYEIFSEPSATWGKSGTQFGILNGAGNGLYAISQGASTRPADGSGSFGGFAESDVIGDGDPLITTDTVGADGIMQAYSMGPGAATQADIQGFGAFATGSYYSVANDTAYLGFTLGFRNGFVKASGMQTGQRNRIQILGWGIETEAFAPIHASLGVAAAATPEPSTLAMLAIGGVGLLALRRRRKQA